MGPKIRRAKRFKAAQTVQKYIRGYLSKKHHEKELAVSKLEHTAVFFDKMREDHFIKAQIVIAYHFKKFLKKKLKEEAEEK